MPALNQNQQGSGDEWEYEYDDNETEDFYFTLDLTSHVQPLARRNPPPPIYTRARPGRRKQDNNGKSVDEGEDDSDGREANSPGAVDDAEDEEHPERSAVVADSPSIHTAQPTSSASRPARQLDGTYHASPIKKKGRAQQGETRRLERIQVLDIASDEPLISDGDTVYSCRWTTAVGTDMLYSLPNPDSVAEEGATMLEGDEAKPKLIAVTPVRLVAHPLQLKPRAQWEVDEMRRSRLAASVSSAGQPTAVDGESPRQGASHDDNHATQPPPWTTPALIPPGSHPPRVAPMRARPVQGTDYKIKEYENQRSFLTRFQAIKQAKGETDVVPLHFEGAKSNTSTNTQAPSNSAGAAQSVVANSDNNRAIGKSVPDDDSDDENPKWWKFPASVKYVVPQSPYRKLYRSQIQNKAIKPPPTKQQAQRPPVNPTIPSSSNNVFDTSQPAPTEPSLQTPTSPKSPPIAPGYPRGRKRKGRVAAATGLQRLGFISANSAASSSQVDEAQTAQMDLDTPVPATPLDPTLTTPATLTTTSAAPTPMIGHDTTTSTAPDPVSPVQESHDDEDTAATVPRRNRRRSSVALRPVWPLIQAKGRRLRRSDLVASSGGLAEPSAVPTASTSPGAEEGTINAPDHGAMDDRAFSNGRPTTTTTTTTAPGSEENATAISQPTEDAHIISKSRTSTRPRKTTSKRAKTYGATYSGGPPSARWTGTSKAYRGQAGASISGAAGRGRGHGRGSGREVGRGWGSRGGGRGGGGGCHDGRDDDNVMAETTAQQEQQEQQQENASIIVDPDLISASPTLTPSHTPAAAATNPAALTREISAPSLHDN